MDDSRGDFRGARLKLFFWFRVLRKGDDFPKRTFKKRTEFRNPCQFSRSAVIQHVEEQLGLKEGVVLDMTTRGTKRCPRKSKTVSKVNKGARATNVVV